MKKKYALIACLTMLVYLLIIFISVNYNLSEFKLSIKSLFRQELTLKEIKDSSIFKAYNQINPDTKAEEINSILQMRKKNIANQFKSWYYPYGSLTVWYNEIEKPRVITKVVSFETPYTININEKELYSVFECNSLKEINVILGESLTLGRSYNSAGEVTNYNYEWSVKTNFSETFVAEIEKRYNNYVSFHLNSFPLTHKANTGKFILSVSIKGDNKIEKISLVDYYDRR